MSEISNQTLAKALRFLASDIVTNAKSGHPGMPLGFADVATCLAKHHLRFNPKDPTWPNRDRLVLSCGHGSALLYAMLYLLGYDYTIHDLMAFRKLGAKTHGHPEFNPRLGVEATTGPLGQGVAMAVGMALSGLKQNALLPDEISYRVYAVVSDGDMMEGISHEACSFAGSLGLRNLTILYDYNNITIDGALSSSCSDDVRGRFESYGFFVQEVDGHDFTAVDLAIADTKKSDRPSIIICNTVIGRNSPRAGLSSIHGAYLTESEIMEMRQNQEWAYDPFQVPDDILHAWRSFYRRNEHEFTQSLNGHRELVQEKMNIGRTLVDIEKSDCGNDTATRAVMKDVIPALLLSKNIIVGSADLGGSTSVKVGQVREITKGNFDGNYINYGVREHAMAAIANGVMADSPFLAITSTFLVFSDYMRPAIRLAAMMGIPQIFILTHDSIGVGEDGPTHQPIEHLASLRSIPGLCVFRPCNIGEVVDSVACALLGSRPSVIALSRQKCRSVFDYGEENRVKDGGYVAIKSNDPRVAIFASGSEVQLACGAAKILGESGIGADVISVPCLDFLDIGRVYELAPLEVTRVFIEAGSAYGWAKIASALDDLIISIDSFGESGASEALFEKYGFSPKKVADRIMKEVLCYK